MFQSPKSGKFESNTVYSHHPRFRDAFQSPKSGKFESNDEEFGPAYLDRILFQSPKSGKFESNMVPLNILLRIDITSFNPLNRGNLNQMFY